jgi:hypothetical protein
MRICDTCGIEAVNEETGKCQYCPTMTAEKVAPVADAESSAATAAKPSGKKKGAPKEA